ncbi:MAG: hypothetical protein ABSD68_01450 [Candidatus Micrarchaeales archaeon]|jgi:hypothetical protein
MVRVAVRMAEDGDIELADGKDKDVYFFSRLQQYIHSKGYATAAGGERFSGLAAIDKNHNYVIDILKDKPQTEERHKWLAALLRKRPSKERADWIATLTFPYEEDSSVGFGPGPWTMTVHGENNRNEVEKVMDGIKSECGVPIEIVVTTEKRFEVFYEELPHIDQRVYR